MAYRIFETPQFKKDLTRLGPSVRVRLEGKLHRFVYPVLAQNPRWGPNVKRLRDFEPPTWRYRVGQWRFFFTIDDQERVVSMLAAEPRSRAYR